MTANSSSPLKSDLSRSTAPDISDSCNAHTRLHITPLDQDLLKVVLPASVLPQARNISLHTLETFPEKRYGYVDLPEADAEKLRKRLNGTTFKGVKMRIEKARPMPVHEPEDADAAAAADARKERKKRKAEEARDGASKRRRDLNVVEGVLLKDRKVKRGWTESTDSKVRSKRSKDKHADKDKDKEKEKHKTKRLKSKYTDQDECLLKTRLPPNVAANLPASEAHKKKKTKNKSLARQITVHEFERTTTFPSFLKHVVPERQGKEPAEFVQGKGWVDEDGALVEAVQCKDKGGDVRGESKKKKDKKGKKQKEEIVESDSDDEDDTSSSGTSSDEDENEDEDEDKDTKMSVADTPKKSAIASPQKETRPLRKDLVSTSTRPTSSSSSSSSSSSASSSASSTSDDDDDTPEDQPQQEQEQEQDQEHQTNLTLDIPATKTPHPLEALYKREITTTTATAAVPAKAPTPFSFFAHDPEETPDSPEPHTAAVPAPTTPYTRQDLEYRNLRSAAPTPDTANPARRRAFWAPDHDQEEDYEEDYNEEDEEENEGGAGKGDAPRGEAGDFQSWFWQNRRDLNQAWMNRRKTAAKERRHRENKARASKAI